MNFEKIASIAQRYQENTSAYFGFAFKDLNTGKVIDHHGDEAFPTASSYKLFVLAELFRKVHTGECSLLDRIPLTEEVKSEGSGVLQCLGAGLNPTLKDYATLMMIISDNTATDVLFNFLGRDNIKKNVIDALGLEKTKCDWGCKDLLDHYYSMNGRTFAEIWAENGNKRPSYRNVEWYKCITEENDQTAPLEAMKMLELVYRGEWVSKEASEGMIAIMKECQTNSRIPRHLPIGVDVAHKTGTLDRLNADIGIVYTAKGDYILCLFYNGNLANEEDYAANAGDDYLAALSKEIYEAYMEE